ncbi:hypothetical protein [Haloarcula marismortui]|uniref:Uncharacterized protein n=1 Tax=Haloarcula marismortui ATCC 33800 TaxID=662476 RepID=A0A8T8KLL7_9EURY|nr:hypothetical protein [Haloarcula sinaiiensis]QUJ74767.1 hypothetical protein KDQ40_21830 [Haloarcula sinaiiensis ATCC 33800]
MSEQPASDGTGTDSTDGERLRQEAQRMGAPVGTATASTHRKRTEAQR